MLQGNARDQVKTKAIGIKDSYEKQAEEQQEQGDDNSNIQDVKDSEGKQGDANIEEAEEKVNPQAALKEKRRQYKRAKQVLQVFQTAEQHCNAAKFRQCES